jgi:hypothetical protein
MSTRLLTFLSDIERSLAADEPSPNGGSWSNSRSISYHLGLARLSLASRSAEGANTPMGEVLVHSSNLADGSTCFKATLRWAGADTTSIESIFEKPNTEWRSSARQVAAIWLGGAPAVAENVTLLSEPSALQAVG